MNVATALRSLNNDDLAVPAAAAARLSDPAALEASLQKWAARTLNGNSDAHAFITPRRLGAVLVRENLHEGLRKLGDYALRHADLAAHRRQRTAASAAGLPGGVPLLTDMRHTERRRAQQQDANIAATGTVWANAPVVTKPHRSGVVFTPTIFSQ